jgi:formylglycine-generating enzyme required for sulfatase activity
MKNNGKITILLIGVIVFANACNVNQKPDLKKVGPTAQVQNTEAELTIGSSKISPQDGMVMFYVPAGEFEMGYADGKADEKPVHTVYLDAFWIDQTEITNGKYLMCVAAGACNQPVQGAHTALRVDSSTRDFYYGNPEYNEYPVAYANRTQAEEYCRWAGRRLPTEAEWENAARGTDGRLYPWGNEPPNETLLNYDGNLGDTTKVGSYPAGASPYGALDMAGNMWEWTADYYSADYYSKSLVNNPQGPDTGSVYVERGGSWRLSERPVRSTYRHHYIPPILGSTINSHNYDGFRCAVTEN